MTIQVAGLKYRGSLGLDSWQLAADPSAKGVGPSHHTYIVQARASVLLLLMLSQILPTEARPHTITSHREPPSCTHLLASSTTAFSTIKHGWQTTAFPSTPLPLPLNTLVTGQLRSSNSQKRQPTHLSAEHVPDVARANATTSHITHPPPTNTNTHE